MDGQHGSATDPPVTGSGGQRAGVVPQLIGTDPGELRHAECDQSLGLRDGWSYAGHIL